MRGEEMRMTESKYIMKTCCPATILMTGTYYWQVEDSTRTEQSHGDVRVASLLMGAEDPIMPEQAHEDVLDS